MTQRLNYAQLSPQQFKALMDFSEEVKNGSIESSIIDLVDIRASQLNGCTFCLDMHVKEATIHQERPLRLHHIASWRESQLFSPRERAALAWTEALTKLSDMGVADELYERVRGQFSEKEITDLTFQIMAINAWNRVSVAMRSIPGSADKAFGLDKAGLA
ncbi:carboxymuconolactone decarboxylase family protein [Agrobacterium radiobacter]|jgi:AhpD family alkylhydroperoxidase|uniref:carboxymuconolactone decarboxylase family protein n=1 Tax=Agrobacterium radiobacter TaxID=362 RepID=UPI0007616972|nr:MULTISPECIES: carboxymuconolactone decarboxylase family protein [Agrobacterium tumefaciens complex]KAB0454753.1 carboxymuconolactone decarboxylase family protein [Agrobacterium tumefaciens]KWT78366.1 alkylhydroperoxidase [Agrobacterium radiobacter]MBB4408705.1 AhpD family alkylhydroperoxidase [Agrobacterium radiobacter]MBB4454400.1 AhpD family alkylhydroperoxidase [Agrobacterium radiobacter]NIB13531.1 carboxymuconolactone decarboxylase family protein [Agrobacterium radiobacter]